MERVYYVIDKEDNHYILNCASYGFLDEEELLSATNDIISYNTKLIINKYVKFNNEVINKKEG